ncbi:hypothetical protein ES708_24808 [subsurface metagenome]
MTKRMTRRSVLAAASTGIVFGTACTNSGQDVRQEATDTSTHPPFLTPWSPVPGPERDMTPGTTPIRLAAWSNNTTLDYPEGISITETVKRIRDAGYTSGNSYGGRNSRNPWLDASDSEIRELSEAMDTYDVTFFDVHTVTDNIHPDLDQRRKNHKHVAECCEAAERVGCPMVTTHSGTRSIESPLAPHKDNWTWETWKLTVEGIKQILKDTAGMKVSLGIEAVNMTPMNNPRAHKQLMEDVGDPRCKVLLDPVNMMHLGVYFRNTELINECFDLLGEDIIAAHAKDTYVLPDRMSAYITEVAPGKGILDYETYLVGLSRLSYPRTLLIEHISQEEYVGAKKYIDDTAAKVGVKIYG